MCPSVEKTRSERGAGWCCKCFSTPSDSAHMYPHRRKGYVRRRGHVSVYNSFPNQVWNIFIPSKSESFFNPVCEHLLVNFGARRGSAKEETEKERGHFYVNLLSETWIVEDSYWTIMSKCPDGTDRCFSELEGTVSVTVSLVLTADGFAIGSDLLMWN